VNVAVYYEALCPDSIKFFTKQLYPTLQKVNISQHVNLTLVPYGKSTTKRADNQITFECHHGEGECRGNKLQACALKHIDNGNSSPEMGYNKITVAFINCLMDRVVRNKNDTEYPIEACEKNSEVKSADLEEIKKCQGSDEADNLLAALGDETNKLNPKLKSVPTIVFNMQQKEEDSKLANENFVKALCQYIQGTKPAECVANSAIFNKVNAVVLLLAFASYFF
ncbi:hypothetical protein WA026_016712, partial [Henosepilachna vigintioctopunctata]